jgi:DNA-binding LacI/PurR family transcriptional regulator
VTPQITQLADQLIGDITARKLQPGDRYLTTVDASRLLGVGNGAANRALQLLERRNIISRQQRRGAYILELPGQRAAPPLHRVHFLVHPLFLRTEGIGNDRILLGMQRELPGVHVQISFLPTGDEVGLVQQLISQSLAAETTDGFVLVRASCETQRLVAGSGLPAVVYGAVHPGVGRLSCLDRDMASAGNQITEWLLSRGHQQVAYLNRQITYPGDHATIDSIADTLASAGCAANSLTIRCLPSDSEVCIAEIGAIIARKSPPRAFICRTRRLADALRVAIERAGASPHKFDIAVCDYYLREHEEAEFVYPRPLEDEEQQGQHLARLMLAQLRGGSDAYQRVTVPVKLHFPLRA